MQILTIPPAIPFPLPLHRRSARASERSYYLVNGPTIFCHAGVRLNPQFTTRAEHDALDRQLILGGVFWPSPDAKAAEEGAEFARRGLEGVRFPATALTAQQRTSVVAVKWSLEDAVRSAAFAQHQFVFD